MPKPKHQKVAFQHTDVPPAPNTPKKRRMRDEDVSIPVPITFIHQIQHSPSTVCFYESTLHRLDGPAVIEDNGNIMWYKNGEIHRENGPAITNKVGEFWMQRGAYHRVDGPAVVLKCGLEEWYLEGQQILNPNKQNDDTQ